MSVSFSEVSTLILPPPGLNRAQSSRAATTPGGTEPVGTAAPGRPAEQSSALGSSETAVPFLPFAHGNFPTPSGKAEFYSEALKRQGLDPVVAFTPPEESRHGSGSKAAGFPLELLARKPDNHLNSSFANISSVRGMEPALADLEMHPAEEELPKLPIVPAPELAP